MGMLGGADFEFPTSCGIQRFCINTHKMSLIDKNMVQIMCVKMFCIVFTCLEKGKEIFMED